MFVWVLCVLLSRKYLEETRSYHDSPVALERLAVPPLHAFYHLGGLGRRLLYR